MRIVAKTDWDWSSDPVMRQALKQLPRRRAIAAVLAVLLLAGCGSSDTAIHARLVPPITGTVQVNGAAAKASDPLRLGDTVIARGDDATASVKFEDGTVLHLYGLGAAGGEAKLIVDSYDKGSRAMVARLFSGLLTLASPPKDPPPRKTIVALNTTTATEGTEVKIQTGLAGDTVSLKLGKVTVTQKDGGASVSLTSGMMVQVNPTGAIGTPAKYDPNAASERKFFIGPGEDVDKHY